MPVLDTLTFMTLVLLHCDMGISARVNVIFLTILLCKYTMAPESPAVMYVSIVDLVFLMGRIFFELRGEILTPPNKMFSLQKVFTYTCAAAAAA